MPSDNIAAAMSTLQTYALPTLTGLMGTMGFANGLYSFNSPLDADRVFGITPPKAVSSSKELQTWQNAQTQARGIRNVTGGLAIMGITAFWQFSSLCRASPIAGLTAKRCLGVIFLTGSITGAVDGMVITQFADGEGTSGEAKELGKKTGFGHIVMAVPILALGVACFFV